MDISFMGDSSGTISNEFSVAATTNSEFIEIEFGDYRISAESTQDQELSFNSRLVTLNQGKSKVIIIYQDAEEKLTALEFVETNVPQAFNKRINVVNLQNLMENVSLHFVKSNETLDTANFKITSLEFAKTRKLPYQVIIMNLSQYTQMKMAQKLYWIVPLC
ncbi:hypothetical protein [Paraglaciecola sp. L3A3]|uniref:hypothetical protein n=1 Tax=Paraglaciecola sp. L3A3 TaxID=2686358 RepID=UPI00131ADD4F|nr:hypothetical protein [Paraglaciecola sp. L3A3]